jgi:predicted nucleotidyltransferase
VNRMSEQGAHDSPASAADADTVGRMTTLAEASLTAGERRVVERFIALLRQEFGADVRAVWLYGSRARGERPHEESDVDLLVVLAREQWQDHWRAARLAYDAAEAEGESPVWFAVQVYTPERLAQRREIRSFFIQEVDRDKIVLFGEP